VPEGVKGVVEMVIMDVGGRVVGAYSGVGGERVEVDLQVAPGVYMYQIITATAAQTGKVVIGNK